MRIMQIQMHPSGCAWHGCRYNSLHATSLLHRWNHLLEQISVQLKIGKDLLGLWQRYKLLYSQCVAGVRRQQECADRLLKSATDREITEEESSAWMKDCSVS